MHILNLIVVDDDVNIRRGVASLLRSHGHNVNVFGTAEDCLARDVEADCAILDIALPGISGLDLNERWKGLGRCVPVVFITAHDEVSVLSAVQRTGQPILRKPLDEDVLLNAIARAIGDRI